MDTLERVVMLNLIKVFNSTCVMDKLFNQYMQLFLLYLSLQKH